MKESDEMSNLNNLIDKIISDNREKAASIEDEAALQAKKIVTDLVDAANKEREAIVNSGAAEAEKEKELIITKNNIDLRDKKLAAKQAIIENVFSMAVDRLNNMDQGSYEAFLTAYLKQIPLNGDETLIIPKRYEKLDIAAISASLSQKGKAISLTLEKNSRNISGGFILLQKGLENNNTYEALVDYYRDELEKIVSESLF